MSVEDVWNIPFGREATEDEEGTARSRALTLVEGRQRPSDIPSADATRMASPAKDNIAKIVYWCCFPGSSSLKAPTLSRAEPILYML